MNAYAARAAEVEAAFLAGAETNLNAARGTRLRGTRWKWRTQDQTARVRELLTARRLYDRDLLRSLPRNASRVLTGSVPRWLWGHKRSSVAIASVLTEPERYLSDDEQPGPIGLSTLVAHVKALAGEADVPHLIGVCSPTGFTEDVRRGGLELPNVTLVLVEPRSDGGWNVLPGSPGASPVDCRLFDPEATASKIQRVREEVAGRTVDLLGGGISAARLGEQLGVPTGVVAAAFADLAAKDPELRVSRQRDDTLLYRGAPADVEDDMSMVDWVRQLFSREGNETRKINELSERRARLAQRRDRLYQDIAQLETREADLLKQGRESASPAAKRRVALQIKQLRDDMERLNATARVIGQQVDVISTHIHNLTLIQQGQMARLPATEEITQDAVRAEEMLEQLSADVQMTGTLSAGVTGSTLTDEEAEILKELEGPAPEAPQASAGPAATPVPQSTPERRGEPEPG